MVLWRGFAPHGLAEDCKGVLKPPAVPLRFFSVYSCIWLLWYHSIAADLLAAWVAAAVLLVLSGLSAVCHATLRAVYHAEKSTHTALTLWFSFVQCEHTQRKSVQRGVVRLWSFFRSRRRRGQIVLPRHAVKIWMFLFAILNPFFCFHFW